MAKRGRKSETELSVVTINPLTRPEPPERLNPRQKEIWQEVVGGEPVDFFQTSALQFMLSDYVRHVDAAEKLAQVIDEFRFEWIKSEEGERKLDRLLKIRERETRAIFSMGTKLRITNQSRYTPKAAGTAARNETKLQKPWEM